MKKLIKTIMVVLVILLSNQTKAQFISAELTAAGLTCSMCSKAIYNALLKVPFIDKVDVDLNKSIYTIQFKKDTRVSPDEIKQTVEKAGFSVAELKVRIQFEDIEVSNDSHIKLGETNLHFIKIDKQRLKGPIDIIMIDKGFVSDKKYAKFSKMTTYACFKTGVMASCCPINKEGKAERIYHVTI